MSQKRNKAIHDSVLKLNPASFPLNSVLFAACWIAMLMQCQAMSLESYDNELSKTISGGYSNTNEQYRVSSVQKHFAAHRKSEKDAILEKELYMVVDLQTWQVRYSAKGPDLNNDSCRKTKLWLRRIPAGTFTMGSPEDELGRRGKIEKQHKVTLTNDYYIGVFEVTQAQWRQVMGNNPSEFKGSLRPVECVSYDAIRGKDTGSRWPYGGHSVDSDSFLGVLQEKTGLVFDLPTQAQWEYACRAGTTTSLNSGKNLTNNSICPNMSKVGRYKGNRSDLRGKHSEHTRVGSYKPNAWGLYDMHGNVAEWCLDWHNGYGISEAMIDPKGSPTDNYGRVYCGGCWSHQAQWCRSASCFGDGPSLSYNFLGFRISCQSTSMTPSENSYELTVDGSSYRSENSYELTVDGSSYRKESGSIVSITAEDKPVFTFSHWVARGIKLSNPTLKTQSFTMPANNVTLTAKYIATSDYLVVDLTTGAFSTLSKLPNLDDDTCRTTKLWLRRIPAGTFTMGAPEGELGKRNQKDKQHKVTLTDDYYIGVFEVTQAQWKLIMGDNPSGCQGSTRPVETISYNSIRGDDIERSWPVDGHAVGSDSFLGKLRKKTKLKFDLPTEAQWEYACRAGTTTSLNSGKNLTNEHTCSNLSELGRYDRNKSDGRGDFRQHTKVGSYKPNAWGLYDMHGNVDEWCLDWYDDYDTGSVTDPKGSPTSKFTSRVQRGGSWGCAAQNCRSAERKYGPPTNHGSNSGFRVLCLP